MNATVETPPSTGRDYALWAVAAVMVVGGLFIYYQTTQPIWLRVIELIALLIGSLVVGSRTSQGQRGVKFLLEARNELRRVVWPTRKETWQTTLVVSVMVIIMSILMFLVDRVLIWIMGFIFAK
jgi:preprotein translocase subunit SecE